MHTCELCGKEAKKLNKVRIVGAILNVCDSCASYGKVVNKISASVVKRRSVASSKERIIVDDASELIRKALYDRGMKVKTFARAIGIKESTIQKILNGKISLDMRTAEKIEKFLEIKLIDEINVNEFVESEDKDEDAGVTLGDLVSLK